jgi:hypothetical protein
MANPTSNAHLSLSAQDLMAALEENPMLASWFIDLETGEFHRRPEDEAFLDEEDDPEFFEDSARSLVVEPIGSHESFRIMEAFVEGLPDGELARSLDRALRMRHPFRAFKDTLLDFPAERQRWFQFHDARMLEQAQEWLEDNLPGATLIFP